MASRLPKFLLQIIILLLPMAEAQARDHDSWVIRVQRERHSTRWTLTEWLRIKERMRLMDVWLAMFSSPAKPRFRPEVNLIYQHAAGNGSTRAPAGGGAGGSMEESYAREGSRFRSQIFLTNLVSSTTGLRTLNIDLGVEGEVNHHDELRPLVAATGLSGAGRRGPSLMTGALDFRIFGKHIQDSSLILKGGRWEGNNPWLADADRRKDYPIGGLMAGAELSLYLFRWLGLEGHFWQYGGDQSPGSGEYHGKRTEYLAWIEVSLIRFMIGQYQEHWEGRVDDGDATLDESGLLSGLKLQF